MWRRITARDSCVFCKRANGCPAFYGVSHQKVALLVTSFRLGYHVDTYKLLDAEPYLDSILKHRKRKNDAYDDLDKNGVSLVIDWQIVRGYTPNRIPQLSINIF